jgi:uncharacterized membrane protein
LQPFHWHPAVVHFPIAFLLAGLVTLALSLSSRRAAWLTEAASWLLWVGTLSLWAAVALGLVAARTAPHVPAAWEELYEHRTLGLWTAGLFTVLSVWRLVFRRRLGPILLLAWLGAVVILGLTAWHGGRLVFEFGMGVLER